MFGDLFDTDVNLDEANCGDGVTTRHNVGASRRPWCGNITKQATRSHGPAHPHHGALPSIDLSKGDTNLGEVGFAFRVWDGDRAGPFVSFKA